MKFLAVTLLALASVVSTRRISLEDVIDLEKNTAYGYLSKIGIPLADKVRKAEEEASRDSSRIIGGSHAFLGQFPYQAGLLIDLPRGQSVATAALVSRTRVLTAAHNLNDAIASVTRVTVVLGSVTIFTGGTRLATTNYILHENWNPFNIRNDIAMINLPYAVGTSNILAPIALPSGAQLNDNFAGNVAIASGFGKTSDMGGIASNQRLSFVDLTVITNNECAQSFSFIHASNLCARGQGIKNICTGDSGGPLAVTRNNRPLLIGITSFGAARCESGAPAGFARVTYYMNWINWRL